MPETKIRPEQLVGLLESEIATHLVDHLTMYDPSFRLGDRKVRMAYLEEVSDEIAADDMVVLIEPESGDLYEVEVAVWVRKLKRPEPDVPAVDPNQLTIDAALDGSS
jgi:hypothetical protein